MIPQVFANSWEFMHDIDTMFAQLLTAADTGALEDLRLGDATGGQNDFAARLSLALETIMAKPHTGGATVLYN